ncbi:MAG: RnfABCDGE type electron transport complex subunit D [bacterium]|nr:RnfABCDGE type electron transport complex subunit D [bacterium]
MSSGLEGIRGDSPLEAPAPVVGSSPAWSLLGWGRHAQPPWPPHIHVNRYVEHIHLAFALATLPVVAAGTLLFGLGALWVGALAVLAALVGDAMCQYASRKCPPGPGRVAGRRQVLVIGLLLALTLPVTVGWEVPVIGGLVAVLVGRGVLGGFGNYLWHPVLVGRVVVQLLFSEQLSPDRWVFLAKGRLLTGNVVRAAEAPGYCGFGQSLPSPAVDAWAMERPIDLLTGQAAWPGGGEAAPTMPLLELFRDRMPPWSDTIWGCVGGGIGETCVVALALGGLLLVLRGAIRWRAPVAALGTVAVLAAVLPVQVFDAHAPGTVSTRWLPVLMSQDGFATGAGLVLFHLTGGGLWLGAWLIATDPVSTPLTTRGQVLFGVGVGALVMVARNNPWYPGLGGAVYWAILGMNTLVPLIDRISGRRVYGTGWRRTS